MDSKIRDCLVGPCAPERLREIPECIGDVDASLMALEESVQQLKDRLNPVLAAVSPTPVCEEKSPGKDSPLGQKMETHRARISSLNSQVKDLVVRLVV